ncbi:MAG: diguanylate cyclase [Actinomycetales bacterium]|nr:diguanylate cyclase [Actinomycetales bacterium]
MAGRGDGRANGRAASVATREAPAILDVVFRMAAERGDPKLAVTVAPDGTPTITWANDAARKLLSPVEEDILGRRLGRTPDPGTSDAPPDWSVAVERLIEDGGGEARAALPMADGSPQPVEVLAVPVAGTPGGSAEAWLVTLQPVADEVLTARAEASQAEQRFAALASNSPVGILMSDVGLRLGYVNECFAQLAGLDTSRLLGTGWLDIVHRQDLPELYDALQLVLGGTARDLTVRLQPVAGTQRWVRLRLTPMTTAKRAAGFLGVAEDITARRAWEEQLAYQANHDALTGLVNRRKLTETISALLDSRRARDHQFAVVFCDLDGFKQVNDTYGHDLGDRVLVEVGRRLTRTAREHDVVGRMAGDEFIVVLRDIVTPDQAETAGRRQLAALSKPVFVGETDITVSASLGIAFPEPEDTAENLLRQADRLMYLAKTGGPGQYLLGANGGGAPS